MDSAAQVSNKTIPELEIKISELENSKTGNLMSDCAIEDEISLLKEKILTLQGLEVQRPTGSNFECFGCGS